MQCAFYHTCRCSVWCLQGRTQAPVVSPLLTHRYLLLFILFAAAGMLLVFFHQDHSWRGKLAMVSCSMQPLLEPTKPSFPFRDYQCAPFPDSTSTLESRPVFIKGLNGYWKPWLQFVFPVYLWAIIVVIIILSRNSLLRSSQTVWVDQFPFCMATLFLLSYAKLLRSIITSLSFT